MSDLFKETGAVFSKCRKYRYRLWRTWDKKSPYVLWIMLNPSTADENTDDNTIRRCINYALDWGFGGIVVCNLFAFRSTDVANMKKQQLPIGLLNNENIIVAAKRAALVVCAWGNDGSHLNRSHDVFNLLKKNDIAYSALTLTKEDEPGHPLYLKKSLTPFSINTKILRSE